MTATTTPRTISEPSAWMRGRIGELIALCHKAGLNPREPHPLVIAPLGRTGAPGSREDRTCDRCSTFTPEGDMFYATAVHALPGLLITGGLCARCGAAEMPDAEAAPR